MIATVDVIVNAAHPEMPLTPFEAHVNSPSSVRVANVPKSIGSWKIESVQVTANYPDNQSVSVEAKLVDGLWVATLAASAAVGTSVNGYQIAASGTDENGAPVVGYVLGVGDVEILSRDGTVTVGGQTFYVHMLDSVPTVPKKGDLCVIDNVWKIYNGTAWVALGSVTSVAWTNIADIPILDAFPASKPAANTGNFGSIRAVWEWVISKLTWNNIASKPTTFPPSSHTHTQSQITNLGSDLTEIRNSVGEKRDLDDFSVGDYPVIVYTIPTESQYTDVTKYGIDGDESTRPGYTWLVLYYNVGPTIEDWTEIGRVEILEEATEIDVDINGTDGLVYHVRVMMDSLVKMSELEPKLAAKLNVHLKGAANGVAELDSSGKVPSAQLPSYVDDVVEYMRLEDFPDPGESGKIYIAKNTNITYRWSGTQYVEISPSLALGETDSTAYRGDRGKVAYDHSQTAGNPHATTLANVLNGGKVQKADLALSVQNSLDLADAAAPLSSLPFGCVPMSFHSTGGVPIATATDAAINVAETIYTTVTPTVDVFLPVPASNKAVDLIVEYSTLSGNALPQINYKPAGGGTSDIQWSYTTLDTVAAGDRYWDMISLVNKSGGGYIGTITRRKLTPTGV